MRLSAILSSAVALPALMVGGVAWAETAIPGTTTGYTIPSDGDYGVASGVSVGNTGGDGISNARNITFDNAGTISGSNNGLSNTGTITTLTNAGTINGYSSNNGILNAGAIGTLTNTGTLSGSWDGFGNVSSGTITTLINYGTISGITYGIGSDGIITTLTNHGTISGNSSGVANNGITTTLTNNGTISGNSNGIWNWSLGTIGTLTNLGTVSGNTYGIKNAGTIGTLTNAQSGLTYSGKLPGTYNTYFSTASSFGTTVFSNISGGTGLTYGLAKANGVSYAVGTYANAIASSSPLTFTYASVNGVTYALVLDTSCSASSYCYDLSISAAPGSGSSGWAQIGQQAGGNGAVIGRALDQIAAQNGLSSQLSSLSALPSSEQQRALTQMGATSLSASVVASGTTMTPSNAAIGNHLGALLAQSAPKRGGATGLSTGEGFHKGAIWGEVLGNHSSLASSSTGAGFSSTAYGLLVGADAYISDNVVTGLGLNWLRNSARGATTASGNSSVTDTYQANLYGSWRPSGEALWLQGLASVGLNQYEQRRGISFLGETARAKYLGLQIQTKLTMGYDMALDGGYTLTPTGSLRIARTQNRAYTETGSSVNQHVEGQAFNSIESVLGAKLARSFETVWGKLTTDGQVGWLHDYVDSPITTVANLSGVSYVLDSARLPADGAQLAVGGTLQQSDDLSLRLEYQGDVRSGYTSHTGLLKARQSF